MSRAMQAYFSFVNHMTSALAGSGLAIVSDVKESATPPCLKFSMGPTEIEATWIDTTLVQAWLIVPRTAAEPLDVTMARYLERVISAGRDMGLITLYDHAQTPPKATGSIKCRLAEVSQDLSTDTERARRVVTWDITSTG